MTPHERESLKTLVALWGFQTAAPNLEDALKYLDQIHKERKLELDIFASRTHLFVGLWSAALVASVASLGSTIPMIILGGPMLLGGLIYMLAKWSCNSLAVSLNALNYRHMWWTELTREMGPFGNALGFQFRFSRPGSESMDLTHDAGFWVPWKLQDYLVPIWVVLTLIAAMRIFAIRGNMNLLRMWLT